MSTPTIPAVAHLSSAALLTALHRLVAQDQRLTAELLAHLGEVDARRLYLQTACPSMFMYCVQLLHWSEDVAFKRLRAARAARRFPVILALVAEGALHLSAVALLAPHLYKVQLTVSGAVRDKLRQAQDLLRHAVPDGDLAQVLERALEALLRELRHQRYGATAAPRPAPPPRPHARALPAALRREVSQRDGEQCTYVDPQTGRRCPARAGLQFHHVDPYGRGGATTSANVVLLCGAHHGAATVAAYGPALIARRRATRAAARGRPPHGGGPGAGGADPGGLPAAGAGRPAAGAADRGRGAAPAPAPGG
jgi:hypothetical protein